MTLDPTFLTLGEVLEIHRTGVRDMARLESALTMPRASSRGTFAHDDLFEMAAAYLLHIVRNHPFLDGNKRVGAVAALVSLELNGFECRMTNDALVDLVLAVAEGKVQKGEIAKVLRRRCRPLGR